MKQEVEITKDSDTLHMGFGTDWDITKEAEEQWNLKEGTDFRKEGKPGWYVFVALHDEAELTICEMLGVPKDF